MKRGFILFGLVLFLVLPVASAEILFGQIGSVYNVGDKVHLEVVLSPDLDTSDFFSMNVICGNSSVELYKSPYSIEKGNSQTLQVDFAYAKKIIGNMSGICYLTGSFGNEYIESQNFEISNSIDVTLGIDKFKYDPGQTVNVEGEALLRNGDKANGFAQINIEGINFSLTKEVKEGELLFDFVIPKDAPTGDHNITIKVYEKEAGVVSNEGLFESSIYVNEIFKGMEVLSDDEIVPGENFSYEVRAYDQAGEQIERDTVIRIYSPDDKLFLEDVVKTGNEINFASHDNYVPGYWKIEAKVEDVSVSKLIYFEEHELASFLIANNTLNVKNIGNVFYDNPIEITIGNKTLVKEVKLDLGEEKNFRLSAPDANYSIAVASGDREISFDGVALTGNAISVGGGTASTIGISIGAVVLILAIGAAVFIYYRRKTKKGWKKDMGSKVSVVPTKKVSNSVKGTEGAFVGGKKEEASVVVLRTSNNKNGSNSVFNSALMSAKEKGAKIYSDGNYFIMIFSNSITNSDENDSIAVRVAKQIEYQLAENNRVSKEKIDFGLGVNNGNVVVEKHGSSFKVTSLGGLISVAKKLSACKEQTLISKGMHGRLGGGIKTQQFKENAWIVKEIVDRGQHQGFVKGFLDRQKK